MSRSSRAIVAAACALATCGAAAPPAPASRHVVIPFLASANAPSALEYEGAECERNAASTRMRCEFQQVFLTTTDIAPDTCLVTTNRYERTFEQRGAGEWVSSGVPSGACGVRELVTLRDGGGVRWTMDIRKVASRRDGASCAAADETPQSLSWENLRRPLPCRFLQPGGLSR